MQQDQPLVGRGVGLGGNRPAERLVGQRELGVGRVAPRVPGGHHDQREVHPHGVAERALLHAGEGLGEQGAQLVERPRPLGQQPVGSREDRVHVDRGAARLGHAGGRLGQHRLERRPQRAGVVAMQEVQRRPHRRGAHDGAPPQRPDQALAFEALEPRPQGHERRPGLLGLQAAEPADRVGDANVLADEQQLAGERRAVEPPHAERLGLGHRRIVAARGRGGPEAAPSRQSSVGTRMRPRISR
jgi:hypothetical protein